MAPLGEDGRRNGGQVRRIVGVATSAVFALALSYASRRRGAFFRPAQRRYRVATDVVPLWRNLRFQRRFFRSERRPGPRIAVAGDGLRLPAAGSSAPFSAGLATSPALMQAHIALSSLSGGGASYLARDVDAGLLSTSAGFAPSAASNELHAGLLDAAAGLYTAAYQPVAPQAEDFARPRNAGIRHDAGAAGDRRFQ